MLVGLLRRGDRAIRRRLHVHRNETALSSIVLFELYYGASFSERVRHNLAQIEEFGIPHLAFEAYDARAAGEIRAALRRKATPIGPYDVLIAGQALARGLTVVTANVGEFERVEGLAVEDWG